MAITTFLNDNERATWSHVQDKELNELFQEIRSKVSNKYLIQQHVFYSKKWYKSKGENVFSYTLYIDLGWEAQVFNFPSSNGICTGTSKNTLMTYFYGVLTGFEFAQKIK